MHYLEKTAIKIRHSPFLRRLSYLWDFIRPIYEYLIKVVYKDGLTRVINGTDVMFISPECRNVAEIYEPGVWRRLMQEVCEGDIVADVGAFIGLYTVALAKKVGKRGKVIAFEPDPKNAAMLKKHIKLNKISSKVELLNIAIGDANGLLRFHSGSDNLSHVVLSTSLNAKKKCMEICAKTLDNVFHKRIVNIIKIDVEGYEEKVLLGARNLLNRKTGYPRAIFMEVHPYAWGETGSTGEQIASLLINTGYRVETVDGKPVKSVKNHGEIVALKD